MAEPLRRRSVLSGVLVGVLLLTLLGGHYLQAWTATLTPAGLRVTQRSELTVFTWDAVAQASGYLVQYAEGTFADAATQDVTEPVALISGLKPHHSYQVRVATLGPRAWPISPWSAPITFTTQDKQYPLPPPELEVVPALTSIWAQWPATATGVGYEIGLGVDPAELKTKKTDDPHFTFTGLAQNATYYLSARSVWPDGSPASAWSAALKVKTAQPESLRVASYNVKCASCGGKSWTARRASVIATITAQHPDVVGVQETNQSRMKGRSTSQLADLLAGLGRPYAVANCLGSQSGSACHTTRGGVNHGDGIIYNTETVKLLRGGAVKLPKGPGIDRYLVWGVFRQKATGQTFVFGSTHLTPGKSQGSTRRRQAQVVGQAMKRLAGSNNAAIVVGDFNSFRRLPGGNTIYPAIASYGFYDPLAQAAVATSSATNAEKRLHADYSSFNGYQRRPPRHGTYLDYIFVTKMRVSEWETVVNLDSSGRLVGTIPSDHNMLRATIWLP